MISTKITAYDHEVVEWRQYPAASSIMSAVVDYLFRWSWVTPDPDFKVAAFFEVKYLNGAR